MRNCKKPKSNTSDSEDLSQQMQKFMLVELEKDWKSAACLERLRKEKAFVSLKKRKMVSQLSYE